MSRAFVKEDSNNQPEDLPARQASGLPNYVTPQGLEKLQRRVEELSAARKPLAAERSEDPFQRQRLSLLERDLRYYETRLKNSILVDNSGCEAVEVRFGAAVIVRDDKGILQEFSIVGEDEADTETGRISWASPLASALLGARAGDRLFWKRKSGETRLELVSIRYPLSKKPARWPSDGHIP